MKKDAFPVITGANFPRFKRELTELFDSVQVGPINSIAPNGLIEVTKPLATPTRLVVEPGIWDVSPTEQKVPGIGVVEMTPVGSRHKQGVLEVTIGRLDNALGAVDWRACRPVTDSILRKREDRGETFPTDILLRFRGSCAQRC